MLVANGYYRRSHNVRVWNLLETCISRSYISAERCVKCLGLCPPVRRQASPGRQRGCQPRSAEGDQCASWLHQKAGEAENAPTDLPARPNSHSVFVWWEKKKKTNMKQWLASLNSHLLHIILVYLQIPPDISTVSCLHQKTVSINLQHGYVLTMC